MESTGPSLTGERSGEPASGEIFRTQTLEDLHPMFWGPVDQRGRENLMLYHELQCFFLSQKIKNLEPPKKCYLNSISLKCF